MKQTTLLPPACADTRFTALCVWDDAHESCPGWVTCFFCGERHECMCSCGHGANAALRERNTALEHCVRLQHEVDRLHYEIAVNYREMARLLQGSSPVPNN
jgi:hypothetical protein